MTISRELIRQIRAMDAYDLRRLQMLIRGLLLEDSAPEPEQGAVTFRQEMVRCGKKECGRCPHGPYWYAYWREDGRTRSRYVGKELPGERD
ncbi:MAG TPA: hypothetical protein VFA34_10385 [Actinomycetota bacterium]|jgi:hypothetical protein|nr:hypothetical protein [Actinomycetota bacterium]